MSEPIAEAIRAGHAEHGMALVGYVTAGFPTKGDFRRILEEVSACCDVVEVGVPFSDPMADGTTIQRASATALRNGVTLPWIIDEVHASRRGATPTVLMSYMNPLLAFGLDRLAEASQGAAIAGYIVPDLPFEESEEVIDSFAAAQVSLITMVTPVTPERRLARLCEQARGFVYAVSMTGITGKNLAMPNDIVRYLDRVREFSAAPVCAGFGIRSPVQVRALSGHVDGVVVGSALVEVLENKADATQFLQGLRAA